MTQCYIVHRYSHSVTRIGTCQLRVRDHVGYWCSDLDNSADLWNAGGHHWIRAETGAACLSTSCLGVAAQLLGGSPLMGRRLLWQPGAAGLLGRSSWSRFFRLVSVTLGSCLGTAVRWLGGARKIWDANRNSLPCVPAPCWAIWSCGFSRTRPVFLGSVRSSGVERGFHPPQLADPMNQQR